MDLSKLSADLPLSQPVSEQSLNSLNKELSEEFKIGARSIAALYRLSNTKTSMVHSKGYLDCINDILKLMESTDDIQVVRKSLELKRFELTGEKRSESFPSKGDNTQFSIEKPAQFHFPLTQPPMSIKPQVKYPPKLSSRPKPVQSDQATHNLDQDSKTSIELFSDSDSNEEIEYSDTLKRKIMNHSHVAKKPKFNNI